MASVILAGTPAVVVGVGGGADGITSVVGGLYTSVDTTVPSAPVVNSTLVAGDGILISAGILNGVSANLAAGNGITVTPPVAAGDPITIASSASGSKTTIGSFGPTGAIISTTPFPVPATGWYLISNKVFASGLGQMWTAGSSYFSYYVEKNNVADVDSYMSQYAQLPDGAQLVMQNMRYYTAGDSIIPYVIWGATPNLGAGGTITMFIQQLFV